MINLKKVRNKTAYNAEKQNKRDNFKCLNEKYCKKGQTVLVGDSITEIYNYKELFADYERKSGFVVYNRGISGDTSDRLLERYYDNVLNIAPRNIVLLIGTNDFAYGGDVDFACGNIQGIIDLTKKHCPNTNLTVLAVYPVKDYFDLRNKRTNKNINMLNERLAVLCKESCVRFVDFTDDLRDKTGNLCKDYTYDGLHLNVKGFEIVTKHIIPLLK